MRFFLLIALATLGSSLLPLASAQEDQESGERLSCLLLSDEENVVASELMGEWISDHKLDKRLGGRSDHAGKGSVIFRRSKDSEKRIMAFFDQVLAEAPEFEDPVKRQNLLSLTTLYLAGEVEFKGKQQDFALISTHGTPRLVFYDRADDLESENVMLARDEEGDNDLLFLGGDFNNQSFGAFKRVVAKADR